MPGNPLWGGIAGAAGGILAPMPYAPKMPWGDNPDSFLMQGGDMVSGLKGNMDYFSKMREGKIPLMSRADQARLTADPRARLAALQRTLLMQGRERDIAAGRGGRSGMYEGYAAKVGEDTLDQQRQLESGVANTLAQMKPQMQMESARAATQALLAQQGLAGEAWGMRQQGLGAQKQHGSGLMGGLYRGLMGFASGMG